MYTRNDDASAHAHIALLAPSSTSHPVLWARGVTRNYVRRPSGCLADAMHRPSRRDEARAASSSFSIWFCFGPARKGIADIDRAFANEPIAHRAALIGPRQGSEGRARWDAGVFDPHDDRAGPRPVLPPVRERRTASRVEHPRVLEPGC